jgi:hypothetical protein
LVCMGKVRAELRNYQIHQINGSCAFNIPSSRAKASVKGVLPNDFAEP